MECETQRELWDGNLRGTPQTLPGGTSFATPRRVKSFCPGPCTIAILTACSLFGSGKIDGAQIDDVLADMTRVSPQELELSLSKQQPQQLQLIAQRLEAASPGSGSAEKIGVFFKAWARVDATSAFAGAIHLKNASLRTKALASVTETTGAAGAKPLVASLSALPTEVLPMSQRGFLISTALVIWSEADPGAAAAYLESISPQGPDYYMAWSQIARRWALKDPPAALRWAEARGGNERGHIVLFGVISGWWEKEPGSAEAYVFARLDSFEGQRMLAALVKDMFDASPEKAVRWVTQLTNGQARQNSCMAVGVLWANNDPKAACAWALSLPADLRSRVLNAAMGAWTTNDPQSAGQWLTELEGEGRDVAVDAYCAATVMINPATAMQWADTIADAPLRQRVMNRVASLWMAQDPDAAVAWIQSGGFPASEQAALMSVRSPR